MSIVSSLFHGGAGWRRPLACAALLAVSFARSAWAADVKLFAADAFKPVVVAMVPAFEKRTGHKVQMVNDTAAALARRIRDGEEFDLAVLPPALLEALGHEGAVADGSIIPLARVLPGAREASIYAGALSPSASNSQAALSLLILLSSEETQLILKDKGMAAPALVQVASRPRYKKVAPPASPARLCP